MRVLWFSWLYSWSLCSCRMRCNRHRVTDARRCVITSRKVGHPSFTDAPFYPLKRRCKVAVLVSNTSCLVSSLKLPTFFLSPYILLFYLNRVFAFFGVYGVPSPTRIPCAITSPCTVCHHQPVYGVPSPAHIPCSITSPYTVCHHQPVYRVPSPARIPCAITNPYTVCHHQPVHRVPSPARIRCAITSPYTVCHHQPVYGVLSPTRIRCAITSPYAVCHHQPVYGVLSPAHT